MPKLPALPAILGAIRRYVYVYVFLAVLPQVRAFHRTRGIPGRASWLTLADLGRTLAVHRRVHRVGALDVPRWLALLFRGANDALGRLQFQRA